MAVALNSLRLEGVKGAAQGPHKRRKDGSRGKKGGGGVTATEGGDGTFTFNFGEEQALELTQLQAAAGGVSEAQSAVETELLRRWAQEGQEQGQGRRKDSPPAMAQVAAAATASAAESSVDADSGGYSVALDEEEELFLPSVDIGPISCETQSQQI